MTAVLNAANERANELFRGEKLGYLGMQAFDCFYYAVFYHYLLAIISKVVVLEES